MLKLISIVALVLGASQVFAVGLTAPFAFDSTATLPKGVRNVRLIGMTTQAQTFFDENSNAQPLGHTMARNITFGEMIDALPDAKTRADYRGILDSRGISQDEVAGESLGIVTARVSVALPVFAYGVTERWTTGIAVPIVYSTFRANTGFKARPRLSNLVDEMYAEGYREEMASVGQMTQDVIQHMNNSNGYGPFINETRTDIGDINLINKYRFIQEESWALAGVGTVILPTGRQNDPNRLVDIGSGDDAWSVGAGVIGDYFISGKWTATGSFNYLHQFSDNYPRRLPQRPDFNISGQFDGNIIRDRGDILRSSWGLRYRPFEDWTFSGAYGLGFKGQDSMSGTQFPAYRYSFLEFNTEQWMHSGILGIGYSTVNKFKRQAAAIPFEVNLHYAGILYGRNVPRDDMATLELVMYF
jgi:hypothetical protein